MDYFQHFLNPSRILVHTYTISPKIGTFKVFFNYPRLVEGIWKLSFRKEEEFDDWLWMWAIRKAELVEQEVKSGQRQ